MNVTRKHIATALIVLAAGVRLLASDEVTLFRIFLNDGTAVVSYGEFARVGDRVVFSMPIGAVDSSSPAIPNLHVVNIPATAVDWSATSKYAESARFAHYAATTAEADYAVLTGDVASVLNSIMFTKDRQTRLDLAVQARRRLASWPKDHFGYRSDDVRQVLGLLDEVISELRAAAGETAFSLDLIATAEPPKSGNLMASSNPTKSESIAQAMAVAKISDEAADRVSILRAVVAALDEPGSITDAAWAKSTRQWAVATINHETSIDTEFSQFASTVLHRAAEGAAQANVRDVEKLLTAAERKDAQMGHRRADAVNALLAEIHVRLDAARRLRLARDRWRERVGSFRAYQKSIEPVFETLQTAQRSLDDIKRLAGSEPAALVSLNVRLQDSLKRLSVVSVPDELKPAHALLQSSLGLAANAIKTRRQAVVSGELQSAWDASSAAAGSMMLFGKAREDMEATLELPHIR